MASLLLLVGRLRASITLFEILLASVLFQIVCNFRVFEVKIHQITAWGGWTYWCGSLASRVDSLRGLFSSDPIPPGRLAYLNDVLHFHNGLLPFISSLNVHFQPQIIYTLIRITLRNSDTSKSNLQIQHISAITLLPPIFLATCRSGTQIEKWYRTLIPNFLSRFKEVGINLPRWMHKGLMLISLMG